MTTRSAAGFVADPDPDPFRPVAPYFPGMTPRWIAKSCRLGRIPGAVKIGGVWLIRDSAIAAIVAAAQPTGPFHVPTVEEAAAELRALGILPGAPRAAA